MRISSALLGLALFLCAGERALGACDPGSGDAAAIAAARAEIDYVCACASFARHPDYVRCVSGVIATRVGAGALPRDCRAAVKRCAARSTCGRPGAVTCCRTLASGGTRCSLERDPARCVAPPQGSACVGAFSSCCDACAAGGCAPPPTPTPSPPCGGGPFACGGDCPAGLACAPIDDFPPYCGCVPDGSQPCGDVGFPYCNGTCPAGEECGPLGLFPAAPCACLPAGSTPCGEATFPGCGAGACPSGAECAGIRVSSFDLCVCVDPGATCGCSVAATCPGGDVCDIGQCVCTPP